MSYKEVMYLSKEPTDEIKKLVLKLGAIKESNPSDYHYIRGFIDCLHKIEEEKTGNKLKP